MGNDKKNKERLFEEFPPISTAEWEEAIKKDIHGEDYKKKLRWNTGEGINILPFYRREDLHERTDQNIGRSDKKANHWQLRTPVVEQDIAKANASARKALANGADAIQIKLRLHSSKNCITALEGTPITSQREFAKLFNDIALTKTPVHFDCGPAAPALIAMLWNESQSRGINSQKIQSDFLYDPFTFSLRNGFTAQKRADIEKELVPLITFCAENLSRTRLLGIDARIYHNAGGTIVQELGYALAAASEYLSISTENGFDVEDVSRFLHFNFAVGSKYFLEIAKFRALKLLWKNLVAAYQSDADTNSMYIHAETSKWNKTLYEPYTNMLRTATEGMSAVIGGCNALTILPFDQHFRRPDDFSQRIARNQQLIMREEAYLDKVANPASGSYYIEKLSQKIAEEAWNLFREVEQAGGLSKAIKRGTVQDAIKESEQRRRRDIASRKQIIVGVNKFTNPANTMADEIDIDYNMVPLEDVKKGGKRNIESTIKELAQAFSDGAHLTDLLPNIIDLGGEDITAVCPSRASEDFEHIRRETENQEPTPKVLILPFGNKKMRNIRADFAGDLFGSAGYQIEQPIGFENIEDVLESLKCCAPDIAVICSTDEEYHDLVPPICEEIRMMNISPILVLAGFPKKEIETYNKAGIDEYIYAQCNALEILERCQQKIFKYET